MKRAPPSYGHARNKQFPLEDSMEYLRLLWTLGHALNQISQGLVSRWGVTGQERLIIKLVERYPGISAKDLALAMSRHPSTLTRSLRELTEGGYLTRERHAEDSRRAAFYVTALGAEVSANLEGTAESAVRVMVASAPPEEVERAMRLLRGLLATLQERSADGAPPSPALASLRKR